jgi:hypothetical protein
MEKATLSQNTGSTIYTITPTTQNCANASAPIITVLPTSTTITSSSTVITWTTNVVADSTVSYGTSTAYGATSTSASLTTVHSISLTGLSASTLYHYAVTSGNYGTSTISGDNTFMTASTNPPTVLVTAPVSGAIVQGTSVTLSATTTPSQGNTIASVQFLADGADVGPLIASAPYQYAWDSTGVSDGTHAITALVTDSEGHQSTSAAVPITVQNSQTGERGGAPTSTAVGGGSSSYSVFVNGGATSTATTSITLSLYGSGAYTMEVSETSSFMGAAWMPYSTSMPWTLAPDLGDQTVYVQFKSVGGTIIGNAQTSIDLVSASSSSTAFPSPQSSTATTASLTAEIADLESQLAALQAEANGTMAATSSYVFTRNLYLGITGNDVKQLQLFLISQKSGSAAQKLASHGTTEYFGILTQNALIEFQKKVSIKPAVGYFGPITRKYINVF